MKEEIKKEGTKMSFRNELKEWIEAIVVGALAGPFFFHFIPFAVEWYAVWLEFLAVTFFWRVIVHRKTFHISRNAREWIEVFVIAGILALNIRTFAIQPYKIPSGSMIPTLQIKDHLFVSRFNYWVGMPKRGDIVVFQYPRDPKKDFIKRVVALGGETITIRKKQVFINGKPIEEFYKVHYDPNIDRRKLIPYYPDWTRDDFGPFVVPDDHIFVMGDNRDSSLDSRYWGSLHWRKLKGRALVIYWPFKRVRVIK